MNEFNFDVFKAKTKVSNLSLEEAGVLSIVGSEGRRIVLFEKTYVILNSTIILGVIEILVNRTFNTGKDYYNYIIK